MTGDLFKARFADCHFDESVYPTLGGEHKSLGKEIDWNSSSLSHLDPQTNQCEQEVQRIIYLQNIANQLPDAFTNFLRITKSHIPAVNAPVRVDISTGQIVKANESRPHLKRDEDFEPKSDHECRQRNDWPKWKDAIQAELASLENVKFLDR
ncbi:uncharacterized protein LOC107025933 [Solanum pennellii]|uniref:Uncharacterized protein LOC107025933 n=1 Tax=Solanum pennellii TaxID=28526 RepID=A0ABM1H967_SOLPN|nr:uncharacterized protein LOC107025933 [Solanum pennellii]